jgi:topoisomerase-4 subunit A
VRAFTTDKLLVYATNGKFFTLEASQLPGGRGHGEPVRLMVDLEESHDIVELFVHEPGRKLLVAATSGHGFIVPEGEVIASTRKGKQVLNVDAAATIGENRRMLVFSIDEVNEMTRGKGIILQRFKDGGLSDARAFVASEGLTWVDGAGRNFTLSKAEMKEWLGQRAQAGRTVPKGFPRSNRFGPAFGA